MTARIVMGLHHTPCRIVGEMDGRPTGAASAREQSAVIVFEERSTSEAIKDGKAAPLGVEAIADAGRRHVDVPVVLARKRISPAQQVGKPPLGRTEEYLGMPVLHADDRPIELHGERDGEGVRPAHPQRRRPATMGVVEQAQRHARSAVKRKVVIGIDEVARRKVDRVAPYAQQSPPSPISAITTAAMRPPDDATAPSLCAASAYLPTRSSVTQERSAPDRSYVPDAGL